jgi:hypothetical protein
MSKKILAFFFLSYIYNSFAQDSIAVILPPAISNTTSLNTAPIVVDEFNSVATEIPIKKKKKINIDRVRILFGLNYSFYSPMINEKDIFQGAYYPVADSSPVWADRNTKNNLARNHKAGHFQFSIQGNVWKGLFVGMNYQFTSIKKYKKDPNSGSLFSKKNTMFFIPSLQVGYVFEFLKNKSLQIHPSIRIGGFTADDYYDSGKGHKFYFGTDLQIRYLIKRKAGFSLGIDYDFLYYKMKDYSNIFHKNVYQHTTFSNIHLNAGLFINVSILTKKQ